MPKPKKNERKEDFIARCVPVLVEEGKPQGQAVAICYSMWEEKSAKAKKRD
jgi:hypothetical protein